MKKLLIISFDLIRPGESETSLAIGSILSFLKNHPSYRTDFELYHLPINMLELQKDTTVPDLLTRLYPFDVYEMDYVAVSAYIWNEYLINELIHCIRNKLGFLGDFILGGYQISYSGNPEKEYPDVKYFIDGYAEQSLLDVLLGKVNAGRIQSSVDFDKVPSPYLTEEVFVKYDQKMVRLETKRGCPYRCSFCAHRDLSQNRVHTHSLEKVFAEFALFKDRRVEKINIVDPIFNAGPDHLLIMKEMVRANTSSLVSIQARFETISGERGNEFLDYCEQLNVNLEFGLQTAFEKESDLINRRNDPEKIQATMMKLNERQIQYEISLIYGLPTQTLKSFQQSVDFAIRSGCKRVTAFPLMLLKGTELYEKKDEFGFVEEEMGGFNIPTVIRSDSFTEDDWLKMKSIAESLSPTSRI